MLGCRRSASHDIRNLANHDISSDDLAIDGRQLITVGAMRGGYSAIDQFVGYFNATNSDYVAQIRYYDDSQQLAKDLVSGNAPDVLEMMFVTLPLNDTYFMDMEQLMAEHPLVAPADFTGNLYQAMRVCGKTFFLIDFFSVTTATAREVDVGPEPGWTMDAFEALLAQRGEGYAAFPAWLSPLEMLHWISFNAKSEFVNYETYTCNFENEAFFRQLQLCKNQPDENSALFGIPDYDSHIVMHAEAISSPLRLGAIRQNYGVYDYTFIGFPNNRGENGSFFQRSPFSVMLAIPSLSPDPKGAWCFVCAMYDDAWQERELGGLPAMQSQMETSLRKLFQDDALPITDADYEKFVRLLNDTNDFVYDDTAIALIIEEEAQFYFSGAIDAAEAARRIQSRVSIYLAEMK